MLLAITIVICQAKNYPKSNLPVQASFIYSALEETETIQHFTPQIEPSPFYTGE
jgi:hypothetical protein